MINPSDKSSGFSPAFQSLALPLAAVCAPLIVALAIAGHFVFNMPYLDDYNTVVVFSLAYLKLPTLGSRLLFLLESQHMEYKFVFEHILVALDLTFTHHASFIMLQIVGNFFLLAICWLLWKLFAQEGDTLRQRLILFVPVAFLFSGLNYSEVIDFPSASLDYLPAMFFSFAALYLLARPKGVSTSSFALACLCALLGYASAVNALLLVPIGLLVLLPGRAWLRAASWCICGVLGLTPYLYRYVPMAHDGQRFFLRMPAFFVLFLGSGSPYSKAAAIFGLLTLAVFVWAIRGGFHRTHAQSFWCWVWLLLSAAMTAYGRSKLGVAASLSPRYMLFSDIIFIFCYQVGLRYALDHNLPKARQVLLYRIAVVLSISCFLHADRAAWRALRVRQQNLIAGLHHYRDAPETQSPIYFSDPPPGEGWQIVEEEARQATRRGTAKGLFSLPNR